MAYAGTIGAPAAAVTLNDVTATATRVTWTVTDAASGVDSIALERPCA
jgi:hypothetical protein